MLTIGSLALRHPVVLAPMASLTDRAFRMLVDEIGGAGLLFTEMIAAEGLRRKNRRTIEMLGDFPAVTPQFIQLFGSDPRALADAVRIVQGETRFRGIDFNMGCPVPKVVRKGEGAALLKDLPRAGAIIHAMRAAAVLPLTVKIRLGFGRVNVQETLRIIEAEGADAVTVHWRLARETYARPARWEWAEKVRSLVRIPLLGNGDVCTPEDAIAKLQLADGVAIGRGALADPFIFVRVAGENIGPQRYPALAARLLELIETHSLARLWLSRLKAYLRFLSFGGRLTRSLKREIFLAGEYVRAKELFGQVIGKIAGQDYPVSLPHNLLQ